MDSKPLVFCIRMCPRPEGGRSARTLNLLLDSITQKVHQASRKLLETGKEISSEMIRSVLLGTDEEKRMVLEIFQHHEDQMSKLVGREFACKYHIFKICGETYFLQVRPSVD